MLQLPSCSQKQQCISNDKILPGEVILQAPPVPAATPMQQTPLNELPLCSIFISVQNEVFGSGDMISPVPGAVGDKPDGAGS